MHYGGDGRVPLGAGRWVRRPHPHADAHRLGPGGAERYDVIIAGASYAGLAAAIALRGLRVLLIDRHAIGTHQTSACGTLLAVVEALEVEHALRQVHHRFVLHLPRRSFEYPLAYPFCTFDHAPFCQTLYQRTDAEFVQATVYGRDGHTVLTDRGAFRGDVLIDASGWGAVLTEGRVSRVARGDMSFGLETEIPAPPSAGLHFWYDPRRLVPRGVGWLFPCGATSRFGVGSYAGDTRLKARLAHFLASEAAALLDPPASLAPGAIHGTYWPYGSRPASTDGVFRVGDAAGHCLPFTGEGIRPALYFGLACGQIVAQVLRGAYSLQEGLAIYRRFVFRHRWMFWILHGVQALFVRLPPTAWTWPAERLTRPDVLHPIMWAYYRLFDPAFLTALRADHGPSHREPGSAAEANVVDQESLAI